ncbi:MAG: hypothetical protein NVSMB66_5920 [Candidatus Doudnabacteria bacterium]
MLNDQIIKTLEYFNIQEHPLTLLELQAYLLRLNPGDSGATLTEISEKLQNSKNLIGQENGFYFLNGRREIVKRRLENNYYSTPRLKRARRYLPGTRFVPFISAVALSGSEAISNSKKGSDIDLFVLTKPNRIWTGRLFLTAYFQILGMRRYSMNIENRFCLNHYIQEGKEVISERHIYTAVEYVSLIPFYGSKKIYEFQQSNLSWIKEYLVQPKLVEYPQSKSVRLKKLLENLLNNSVGDLLEKLLGDIQSKKIQLQDSVVIEKDELSFHPGNKGRQVLKKIPFKI